MRTLLLLCLVSCNLDVNGSKLAGPPAVPSEGLSATQVRPVADFDRVRSEGFVDVIAAVGPEHSAEITCDDVMLPHIDTVVERGTLFVRTRSSGDGVSANARCLVKAAAPAWVAVESTGSGNIALTGPVPGLSLVRSVGSGDIVVTGIETELVQASAAGSGDITVSGTARRFEAKVASSGGVDGSGLQVTEADARSMGSGPISVHASGSVTARIGGSGDIVVSGGAAVDAKVAGSGEVKTGG